MLVRAALRSDVPAIVTLLWADPQGQSRETCDPEGRSAYLAAFDRIMADPHAHIVVVEVAGRVIGCAQFNVMTAMSYQGMTRAFIEDVRIDAAFRGQGYGKALIDAVCAQAAQMGCGMVELFVHKDRAPAHALYHKCGFGNHHIGFRKTL